MNLQNLSLLFLLAIFLTGGAAIWIAGIYLSKSTSVLSKRLGLGDTLGGMILLAIVTNLPEIAIVVSASLQNNIEIAVGNILGGIAMQTLVLVALDVFGTAKNTSLTFQSASLTLALEALLVITILTIVILGHQLSPSYFITNYPCRAYYINNMDSWSWPHFQSRQRASLESLAARQLR